MSQSLKIIVNLFYQPVDQLKKLLEDNSSTYIPVNGGASLRGDAWCDQHVTYDDTGDNISHKNKLLNELTSIYWAWKHYSEICNPDYIGFNHYRRFFSFSDLQDYSSYDLVFSKPVCPCRLMLDQQYQILHNIDDLITCCRVLFNVDADFAQKFVTHMHTTSVNFAPCNMFVMKRDLFFEWCEFIFKAMALLESKINVEGRDNYQKRALCFLCERIFGCWCKLKRDAGLKTKEVAIVERLSWKANHLNERGTFG